MITSLAASGTRNWPRRAGNDNHAAGLSRHCRLDLHRDREVYVATEIHRHVVAFDPAVTMQLRKVAGGVVQTLKSGEGLVFDFTGPGWVMTQTRNPSALEAWIKQIKPGDRERRRSQAAKHRTVICRSARTRRSEFRRVDTSSLQCADILA